MSLYLDSGALVKLYVVEPGSEQVANLAGTAEQLLICPLQVIEVKTAIRAAAGRKLIPKSVMKATLAHFEADLATGVYLHRQPDWPAVWELAEALSEQHVRRLLTRTLDVLHVAVALEEQVATFVTGDKRQARLAKAAGMMVEAVGES